MISNEIMIVIILLAISIQFFVVFKIINYKKIIDEKNLRLVQFHLDSKFIYKGLVSSLSVSESSKFCANLISQIKDYYNLDEFLVVDSIKMITNTTDGTNKVKNIVFSYIRDNINKIFFRLNEYHLKTIEIVSNNIEYTLHISKLVSEEGNDGMIICVEQSPSLLNSQEIIGLENCINLLKTRLFYE